MFEIIGPITDIETFATANTIRDWPACKNSTVLDAGANAKGLQM